MDFSLSPEQLALRKETLEFARALQEADTFDRPRWKAGAAFGLFRALIPKAYGGDERDLLSTVLMLEALGEGCPDNGFGLSVNSQIWCIQEPILQFGSEEQKSRLLPKLVAGELVGAYGMTEPQSGSDALALQTTAVKDGAAYVLNGIKTTVGLAPVADVALVFARTNPEMGHFGISVFLVEADTPGFERSSAHGQMGLASNPLGDLIFQDCRIPETNRLGSEGVGMSLFNHTMDWERSFILASQVGAMARQLEECVAFVKAREQFGKPVGQFQSVSNRIADMALRLETSRLLLYKLAWMKQQDQTATLESALANLHLSESFLASSLDAIRTHGARGYLTEVGIEEDLRDAVGGVIYSGTSDLQRNIIARMLGL